MALYALEALSQALIRDYPPEVLLQKPEIFRNLLALIQTTDNLEIDSRALTFMCRWVQPSLLFLFVCMYTHAHTHTRTQAHTHTHKHTHTSTHTHTHTHTHACRWVEALKVSLRSLLLAEVKRDISSFQTDTTTTSSSNLDTMNSQHGRQGEGLLGV